MITINMLSRAHTVKGQGVLSAHDEQVNLVKQELNEDFTVYENKMKLCNISHFHTINPQYYVSLPFVKAKGKAVGYVHFLPETLEKSIHLPSPIKKLFYKYVISFYKRMDYLVTVNPYFITRLEHYGVDKEKVTYIPNFVSDKQFYKIGDNSKAKLRAKYNVNVDDFTVLCVGQLQKRKGIFDFIEVARQMPHIQFLWAGSFAFGKISDGYEDIKKIVENPPFNVTFLGLIEREKMNEIYNLADVMFLPSFEELFPMTILESMNCGVPILLRDLEIYEDILFDFYLKTNSVDGFLKIISQLQTDKKMYEKAANLALKGHEFYSREHVSKMWFDFYKKVAATKENT